MKNRMSNKNVSLMGISGKLILPLSVVLVLVLIALPRIFNSGFGTSILSEMGIAIVFSLSYNMLLGQGGMLSFGHSVFFGLGGYFAIHAVNMVSGGTVVIPLELIPLVGGFAGLLFGAIFGYISTKKSGVPFALISLGIGELIFASVLLLPSFFGSDEGISCDRMLEYTITGVGFGKSIEVYYLIAFWMVISVILMYLQTQTSLGRIANAVRDNDVRASFIGYNIHMVRFFQFSLSGLFAGIAGALLAINYEIVNAEMIDAATSGNVLIMTYLGGIGHFFGPILGAIIYTFLHLTLISVTEAGQLYLGILFIAIVLWAPNGIAGLIMVHQPVWKAGRLKQLFTPYLAALGAGLVSFVGFMILVEMNYHLSLSMEPDKPMTLAGIAFQADRWPPWVLSIALMGIGGFLLRPVIKKIRIRWDEITMEIEGGPKS